MKGLRTCIYKVSNLSKATEWYSKAFDVKPYFDESYYVGFNIGGYELGLQTEDKIHKGSNIECYWAVDDIHSSYAHIIRLGAKELQPPTNVGQELMVATAVDPWDNIIGLIYNPYFKIEGQTYEILHDLTIEADSNKIYHSITQANHLNNWWTKECSGLAKIGSQYRLYFSDKYDWTAVVTKEKHGLQFELTMEQCSEDWQGTRFGFIIEEQGSGCLLSFYHKDWTVSNHNYKRTSYCWAMLLAGLKDYVETGKIIPFENRS